jgi:hypothetical protein
VSSAKSERHRSRYLLALEEVGIQTPLSQVLATCLTKFGLYMPYGHPYMPYGPYICLWPLYMPFGHAFIYAFRPPIYAFWPPIYALWPPIYAFRPPIYAFRPPIYALRPPIYALRPPIYALWPLICLSATYLCLSHYEIGGLKIRPNRCTYLPVTSGLSQAITGLSDNIGGLKIRPICRTSYCLLLKFLLIYFAFALMYHLLHIAYWWIWV